MAVETPTSLAQNNATGDCLVRQAGVELPGTAREESEFVKIIIAKAEAAGKQRSAPGGSPCPSAQDLISRPTMV